LCKERGLADQLPVFERTLLVKFVRRILRGYGGEYIGYKMVGPVVPDLTDAPAGDVDEDVVVLAAVEESLGKLAFRGVG
jgi:hypothetical protein